MITSLQTTQTVTAWTTLDECRWLDCIGQTSEHTKGQSVASLLRHYLMAAPRRRRWGAMDRQQILAYAQRRLLQAVLEEEGA